MNEQSDIVRAGAKVLEDIRNAFSRGEMSDAVALGFRLTTVALMMKPPHRPGGLKIAQEYATALGFEFDKFEEQASARIYEHVQLAGIDSNLGDLEAPDGQQ